MSERIRTPADFIRNIIRRTAHEHFVRYEDLVSPSPGSRQIARIRHLAIARVAEARPDMGTARIGKYFHRDHSTVMYALGRTNRTPQWKRKKEEAYD